MEELRQLLLDLYPEWYYQKLQQTRPPKIIRQENGRKPNARQVPLKAEYIRALEMPEA